MSNMNTLKGIDSAIKNLNDLKDRVIQGSIRAVNVEISFKRDIKPHYELGQFEPSGFKVEGPTVTLITVTDSSDIGKILK